MTEQERNDLLIEISVQIKSVHKRLESVESEMKAVECELKKRQCLLHTKQIENLEKDFDPAVCAKNGEKIKTIEKLTWAALITLVGLIAKSFWSAITT